MLSIFDIESHYQHLLPEQLNIIVEIYNLVAEISPGVVERLDRWGIPYFDPSRGGPVSAGVCQTLVEPDHIRLAFIHGAFLPDPFHLLEGERQYKRYTKLTKYDQVNWEAVKSLILASNSFDPYTFFSTIDKKNKTGSFVTLETYGGFQ